MRLVIGWMLLAAPAFAAPGPEAAPVVPAAPPVVVVDGAAPPDSAASPDSPGAAADGGDLPGADVPGGKVAGAATDSSPDLLGALLGLASGVLPHDVSIARLFEVDLRDEAAVTARVAVLQREAATLGALTDPTPEQAGALARANARLAFLARPLEERAALLAAEGNRLRVTGAAAVASDQARAADQASADADARHAEAVEALGAAEDALARVRAEDEAALSQSEADLARLRASEAARRAAALRRRQAGVDTAYALRAPLDQGTPAEVRARWAEVDRAWVDARGDLRDALGAIASDPALAITLPTLGSADPALAERLVQLGAQRTAAMAEQHAAAVEEAEAASDRCAELLTLREALLARPDGPSADVRSFSEPGWRALLAELDQIGLDARWRAALWREVLTRPGEHVPALGTAIRGVRIGLTLLLAALLAVVGRRGLRPAGRALLNAVRDRPRFAVVLSAAGSVLSPLLPVLADLVAVCAVMFASAWVAPEPETLGALLFALLEGVLLYRIAVRLCYQLLRWLANAGEGRLSVQMSDRLLKTVRRLVRWAVAAWAAVAIARWLVGDGSLAAVARLVTGAGWAAAGIVVARSWQREVSDAYLSLRPEGNLASTVRNSRGRWYAIFVALAALGSVAIAAGARASRRAAMGFEQTRRVLALLYRRRLEQAEGEQDTRGPLPDAQLAVLLSTCTPGSELWVPVFPGTSALEAEVAAWRGGARTAGIVVTGVEGVGRTTWIAEALRRVGDPVHAVTFDGPVFDPAVVVAQVAAAVGADGMITAAELAAWLARGPSRVVAVDDLQRLVLRGVGTAGPWDALGALIVGGGPRILWVGAMTRDAWEWLEWARPGRAYFPSSVALAPWTEVQIGALLRARTSTWGIRFDGVMPDELGDAAAASAALTTEEEYFRLIWDFADGIPRVALASWAASLGLGADGHPSVRLFDRPDNDQVDGLSGTDRFLLANVAWHAEVTAAGAAESLRYPVEECLRRLDRLVDVGILRHADGVYRVHVRWLAPVRRFLARQHLLNP